jgi:isocitrate/isopropylmalate dehydrogenase
MYWKPPFMEKRQYKPWKRLSRSHVSYEFVDAVAMRLVQWPNSYDVLITENLFEIF